MQYLSTDISGSCGVENIWHPKNPYHRQFAGILGFCFTNAFLAMKYFSKSKLPNHQVKITELNTFASYKSVNISETRQLNTSSEAVLHPGHRIGFSKVCNYFQHGYNSPHKEKTPQHLCVGHVKSHHQNPMLGFTCC